MSLLHIADFYLSIQESLIDASEDSQLEAAIRASLQETHYESTQDKAESRSDDDSDAEPFSDSEGLISVDGSDNEVGGGEDSLDGHVSAEVDPPTRPDSPAHHRKSPHKELCHRKEESKKNHLEPVGLSHSQTGHTESQQRLGENHRSTSHQPSEPAGTSTADPDDNGIHHFSYGIVHPKRKYCHYLLTLMSFKPDCCFFSLKIRGKIFTLGLHD